ncbi:MAG: hypothetical protein EOP04_20030, partial [Proteobacteria bacterium]
MIKFILILGFTVVNQASFAATFPSFTVYERTGKKSKVEEVDVEFRFLKDRRFFESKSFKVVKGRSEE